MKRTEFTCDKCGAIGYEKYANGSPKGWRTIYFRTDRNSNYEKHLCHDCCEIIGIDTTEKSYEETEKSIGERLVDILSEIVQENN